MKQFFTAGIVAGAGLFLMSLTSCEKKELPVTLPPAGPATPAQVSMGSDYTTQVFYDLETGKVAGSSAISSWDLAFEAAPGGYHVFMNGGKDLFCYNTHLTDFSASCTPPAANAWAFDRPSGLPDSTGIGEWYDPATQRSGNNIYLIKLSETDIRKVQFVSVSQNEYVINYGGMDETMPHRIEIPKDSNYNYAYFSFSDNGVVVKPDPPKSDWDIVFTRYLYIYYELNNFPYEVNGAMLNPWQTTAAKDSLTAFNDISQATAAGLSFSNHRDIIGGFGWKNYNFTTGHYDVNPAMCYLIRTRNGHLYKLHFLDFYSSSGEKGSPSFEFNQLQ